MEYWRLMKGLGHRPYVGYQLVEIKATLLHFQVQTMIRIMSYNGITKRSSYWDIK
jgi:hypothetical protein